MQMQITFVDYNGEKTCRPASLVVVYSKDCSILMGHHHKIILEKLN